MVVCGSAPGSRVWTRSPFGIKCVSFSCKSLGIYIGNSNTDHENFDDRLQKLSNKFRSWSQRCLSLQGKAFVANSLSLYGLLNTINSVPTPFWVLTRVYSVRQTFLWSGKTPLVSLAVCIQPKKKGGLFFPDFHLRVIAFPGTWIKRFLSDSEAKWKLFLEHWLHPCLPPGVGAVALFNLARLDLSFFPEFYKEIFYAWLSLGDQGDVRDRSYTIHRSSKDISRMSVKNNFFCWSICSVNPIVLKSGARGTGSCTGTPLGLSSSSLVLTVVLSIAAGKLHMGFCFTLIA